MTDKIEEIREAARWFVAGRLDHRQFFRVMITVIAKANQHDPDEERLVLEQLAAQMLVEKEVVKPISCMADDAMQEEMLRKKP